MIPQQASDLARVPSIQINASIHPGGLTPKMKKATQRQITNLFVEGGYRSKSGQLARMMLRKFNLSVMNLSTIPVININHATWLRTQMKTDAAAQRLIRSGESWNKDAYNSRIKNAEDILDKVSQFINLYLLTPNTQKIVIKDLQARINQTHRTKAAEVAALLDSSEPIHFADAEISSIL